MVGMNPEQDGADVSLEHSASWDAYDLVGAFLQEDGWFPEALDALTAFQARYQGTNGEYRVVVHVNVEMEQVYVYVLVPEAVPLERRAAVGEFLTRANYGLRIGNFELDYRDGEVRYKTSLDFEGAGLTRPLLRSLMYPGVNTLDRYYLGLQKVALEGADPTAIVNEIEGR
jgi:hypothetical protein